jgi:hypothetical protein
MLLYPPAEDTDQSLQICLDLKVDAIDYQDDPVDVSTNMAAGRSIGNFCMQ